MSGLRWLAYSLLLALSLFGVFYAAFPLLVSYGGTLAADRLGLQVLEIRTGRPRLRGMRVDRLEVSGESYRLLGHDGWLTYRFAGLLDGRFEALSFSSADLTVPESAADDAAPGDSPEVSAETSVRRAVEALGALVSADSPSGWTSLLPLAVARVEDLTLRVPRLGFLARGGLSYGAEGLSVALAGSEPPAASRFALAASVSPQGTVRAMFAERDDTGPPFLELASGLAPDALELQMDLRLSGYVLALASEVTGLPAGEGQVQASLQFRVPRPIPEAAAWRAVAGGGPVSLDWRAADGSLTIEGLRGTLRLDGGEAEARLQGRVAAPLGGLSISARLPENYRMTFDGERFDAGPGLDVSLESENASAAGSVSRLVVVPDALSASPSRYRLELAGEFAGTAAGSQADGVLHADVTRTAFDAYQGTVTFAGTVAADRLRLTGRVNTDLVLAGEDLKLSGEGTAGPLGQLRFTAAYHLGSGDGHLEMDGASLVEKPLLAGVLSNWRAPYDLDAGRLGYRLDLTRRGVGDVEIEAGLSISDVSAHYKDYRATGVNGEFALRRVGEDWVFGETPVTAASVDVGVVAREISAFVLWTGAEVQVRGASAALLGGGITAAPFSYYPATGYAAVEVRLVELSLAEVLALEGDDIAGTGRLNGVVPLRVLDDAVTVEAGRVKAAPPGGSIRISEGLLLSTTQPGLDFALRALQNFDYSLLEADVDYAENGDLQLAVRLQGRNPDIEAGRPIHYNLNVSENIPVLLRSLRLQDQVTRQVERRVKN